MRKLFLTLTLLAATVTMTAQTPAFPGAEGHGRYVTGGRGGEVRHVTTLLDDGKTTTKGTLRWAVNGTTKKTVVFDVGGIIELTKDLNIGANTTIAGQTAPAPGITVRYYTVKPNGDNIIIRFLRIRRGEEKDVNDGADALFVRERNNLMFDHCSFSWSIDETLSCYDNRNFTAQWCTIGEGLNDAGHTKGDHGYGGIWGGKGASFHHNLIIHENNRAPRLNGARYNWGGYDTSKYSNSVQAERVDLRNNVMFNWGNGNGAYGGMGGYFNIVNNYYKAGPATANKTRVFQCSTNASKDSGGALPDGLPGLYYINGNYVTAAGSSAANYDWKGVKQDSGNGVTVKSNGGSTYLDSQGIYGTAGATVKIKLETPVETGEVTTHTAQNAYAKVLEYAGASLHRDAVDTRYMKETSQGTTTYSGSVTLNRPGIIDHVSDQGGYTLESTARPSDFDTDEDGMPDEWEQLNGGDLNPNEYTLDSQNQWYTNLEVYLSSLVEDIMKGGNAEALDGVDEYYPECVKMPDDDPEPTPAPTVNSSILWKFDMGTDGQQATFDGIAQNGIKSATVTLGSELIYNGTISAGGLTETKIRQTNPNGTTPTDANTIIFSITPAEGYSLQATSVKFTATRIGTDRGKIDAKWVDDNGTSVICTAVTPKRNSTPTGKEDQSPFYSTYSTTLDGDATTGECKLVINLYDLSFSSDGNPSLKDVGFCNIYIEGILTEPEAVRGDANGDGEIGMPDVMFIVNYILGTPAETFNEDAADANLDGEIGMPDVMFIVQYILNGAFPDE